MRSEQSQRRFTRRAAIVDENAVSCTRDEAAALRAAVQGVAIRLSAAQRQQEDEWTFAEVVQKPFLDRSCSPS